MLSPVIDLRSKGAFVNSHSRGATHFEGCKGPEGLLSRANELPPPHDRHTVYLLTDKQVDAECAYVFLRSKGFSSVLRRSLDDCIRTFGADTGSSSRALWQPAPIIFKVLDEISNIGFSRTALDIGAGSGRDACFLAHIGWQVTAVDRDSSLLSKAEALRARQDQYFSCSSALQTNPGNGSMKTTVRTFGANLLSDEEWLQEHAADLLIVVRFLRRGVLELLPHAVKRGGYVAYEHFLQGCEMFGGPKKQSQMLKKGELEQIFSKSKGFCVLKNEVETLADGRPINRFIACRKLGLPSS